MEPEKERNRVEMEKKRKKGWAANIRDDNTTVHMPTAEDSPGLYIYIYIYIYICSPLSS